MNELLMNPSLGGQSLVSTPLTWGGLLPLLPAGVVGVTILLVMIGIALKRSHVLSASLSVVGLSIAFVLTALQLFDTLPSGHVGTLFIVDGFAIVNGAVVLLSALACLALAYPYFATFKNNKEELYILILTATMGAMLMTSARHFASFFVALELVSVPMYGMLSYAFLKSKSLESGIKYLVLSAAASATMLMGMAFVFADVGSLTFATLGQFILRQNITPLLIIGAVMISAGLAFKLSLAPFHAWAGDVYEGSPAPVTAFLASVGKVAVVALAVRFFIVSASPSLIALDSVLVVLIALSVLAGNLLALYQNNLKRLLAFSSVAHMGYALMALVATGSAADTTVTMYMAIYALTSVGAFGVIVLMTGEYGEKDRNVATNALEDEADTLAVYQGLFWRRPVLTAVMTVMLLSMAGMPMTAGFITKMQVLFATVQGGRFFLAGLLIVGSAIGLYYYLKVILVMYKRPVEMVAFDVPDDWRVRANGVIMILVTIFVFLLGILPNGLFVLASFATVVQ